MPENFNCNFSIIYLLYQTWTQNAKNKAPTATVTTNVLKLPYRPIFIRLWGVGASQKSWLLCILELKKLSNFLQQSTDVQALIKNYSIKPLPVEGLVTGLPPFNMQSVPYYMHVTLHGGHTKIVSHVFHKPLNSLHQMAKPWLYFRMQNRQFQVSACSQQAHCPNVQTNRQEIAKISTRVTPVSMTTFWQIINFLKNHYWSWQEKGTYYAPS